MLQLRRLSWDALRGRLAAEARAVRPATPALAHHLKGTASMLAATVHELRSAHKDMGWSVDGLLMRLALLLWLRNRPITDQAAVAVLDTSSCEEQGVTISSDQAHKWELALRWAYASYAISFASVLQTRVGDSLFPNQVQLLVRRAATPLVPAHVLAVDHRHRQVVLSVRGTLGLRDLVSCTHFGPRPFLGGYAHGGFALSAHALVDNLQDVLRNTQRQYPGYSLMLTGHSLGAGAAALTALLLHDQSAWDSGLEAVCFATPSCASLELAQGAEHYITTLVHADDWVPRLSALALNRLESDARARDWHKQRLALLSLVRKGTGGATRPDAVASPPSEADQQQLLANSASHLFGAEKGLRESTNHSEQAGSTTTSSSPYLQPLYPAGRPYLLPSPRQTPESNTYDNSCASTASLLLHMPHEHFLDMKLSPTMFCDHKIAYYMRAVHALTEATHAM